ncbi:MAG: hypothetical protein ALECFALPRED_005459 [Alectoria fallacina]|uniref:Uncharacterized protein n=1 Tax=Alectoria fallacina TaxID=1903189 RepID=A0A8H3G4Q8_9LECA|nr:MAG: hypothetical protein ALECFALPRED_005459 [Alectoria fallacina]
MALPLTTAFLATTALALPTSTDPVLPQALGFDSGLDFLELTFTIYAEKDCKGEPAGIYVGSYGYYEAYQMQSYRLSRDLYDNERLDFYSGSETDQPHVNHSIVHTLDSHYTEACWLYDVTAGVNATEHDNINEHQGSNKGCQTLIENEWCAVIWKTST